ncbi:MAG: helix-turn-helix transcriptional regulator [Bacilli bacterium]
MKYNFPKVILKLRIEAGLTLEKFGKLFGVKKSTVSGWESGLSTPPVDKLIAICKQFEITPNELLGFESNNKISLEGLNQEQENLVKQIIELFKEKNNG